MKNLCVFVHYFAEDYIPFFVKIYIEELSNYFDEIIIVTNIREIKNSNEIVNEKITIKKVNNEGYDMGMFYKVFSTLNLQKYKTIACINDSNVVFGKLDTLFDWAAKKEVDYWGLVDYGAKTDADYHIQSHFLVFNKKAIMLLVEFFNAKNMNEYYDEKNPKILKPKVINDWEIGLSTFLIKNQLQFDSYISHAHFTEKYNLKKPTNIPLKLYDKMIENGVPIIKRRIINSTNLNHLFSLKWKRLIKKHGDKDWDIAQLTKEISQLRYKHLKGKVKTFLKKINK